MKSRSALGGNRTRCLLFGRQALIHHSFKRRHHSASVSESDDVDSDDVFSVLESSVVCGSAAISQLSHFCPMNLYELQFAQISYRSGFGYCSAMWTLWESNPRPHACEACTLPTELRARTKLVSLVKSKFKNKMSDTNCIE